MYDEKEEAVWPAVALNYTAKTQFLFRIEKGVLDINDPAVNDYFAPEDIRVPFRNIIYIGDSDTDVPCMKLVNSYGGHAIGVYNGDTNKVHKMMRDNRIKYYAEADYSENSEIDKLVKAIIDRTAKYGEGISILFSGFMFGLFHGNFSQFAYAMFLGMFFGFIYIKTKNIMYPIILHFLTNFMGSMVPMLVMDNTRYLEYEEKFNNLMASPEYTEAASNALAMEYINDITIVFSYIVIMFAMIIIGIILFVIKRKKFVLENGETPIPEGERLKTACLNPGVIAFVVFWIVMIVLQIFE